jgi:hypothetical protein
MRLNEDHPVAFLSEIRAPIHAWHQANLHAELAKLPKEKVPSFRPWLQSKNTSVVVFALRMIRHFNQFELLPYVMMKSLHHDLEVRREVWQFISFFHVEAGVELVSFLIPTSEPEMRQIMLNCLGELGTDYAIETLENIVELNLYGLKMEAALALQRNGYAIVARWPELIVSYEQNLVIA